MEDLLAFWGVFVQTRPRKQADQYHRKTIQELGIIIIIKKKENDIYIYKYINTHKTRESKKKEIKKINQKKEGNKKTSFKKSL